MGIEILFRGPSTTLARVVAAARQGAAEAGLVELPGPSNADSIRLVFQQPGAKRFELTVQADGETHAQSFGEPRHSPEADTALIVGLLPGLTAVGSNPSWEPDPSPEPGPSPDPDPSWEPAESGTIES